MLPENFALHFLQVGLKTSVGLTPLHNAASNGHVAVIETLIQAGALVNARAGNNATALFIAAQNGHLEVPRFSISPVNCGSRTHTPPSSLSYPLVHVACAPKCGIPSYAAAPIRLHHPGGCSTPQTKLHVPPVLAKQLLRMAGI